MAGGFKGYKRTITLAFDYDEVKKGIPDVNKQFAVLNARQREASAAASINGKTIDGLGVKYQYLTQLTKIQAQQVEIYKDKLDKANSAQGENAKAVQNATTSLEIAQSRLQATQSELEKVNKQLGEQQGALGKTKEEWDKFADVGKGMTMKLTAPIVAMGAASFKLGADLEDTIGKADVVFGDSSEAIQKWSSTALKEFNLAKLTALSMVTDFASGFNQLGVPMQKATEYSQKLTGLVADLSAYYNTTTEETQYALTAILSGQTEPLKRFNIFMTEANLQQFAYSQGIQKRVREMSEAEKVQLRYNYVMEQTAKAHGQAKREQDSATTQMHLFKQTLIDIGTSFSEHILPYVTPVLTFVNNLLLGFSQLDETTKKAIVTVGMLVAVSGPIIWIAGTIFGSITKISDGLDDAGKLVKKVGEVGSKFGDTLTSSGFFGFAKWALIIAGVAVAIAAVVMAINDLLGRSNSFAKSLGDIGNIVGNIQNTKVRGYAVGTQYHPGGDAIVGEEGPELVRMPKGSKVYTNNQTKDILGGGDTFILQVNMDEVGDVSRLVDTVNKLKQTRRAGVAIG